MALGEVDTLITDAGVPARARAVLEELVDHLVLADVAPTLPAVRGVRRQGGGEAG